MCWFGGAPQVRERTKRMGLVGYKAVTGSRSGLYFNHVEAVPDSGPPKYIHYEVGKDYKAVDAQRVCLWVSEPVIPDALLSVIDGNDGFHVFKHLSDCAEKCRFNDNRILKVKVWGVILHYPGVDKLDSFGDTRCEGYRAAHMTVVRELGQSELMTAWEKYNKKAREKARKELAHV